MREPCHTSPRRVLVVGCGSIGQRHVRNLWQLGVTEILVFDPDSTRVDAVAALPGVKACGRLEAAYAMKPNAVLVCAPTSLHLSLAREAVLQGADVFVEKPLSHTLEGVDGLLALIRELGRVAMVGYQLRFNACARQLKTWLEEGRVGHIASARFHVGSYLPWRHPWEDYRHGYGARRELGGGVILDAIHEIDSALWLFGPPQRVYGVSGHLSNLDIDTEDVAELLLSYPDENRIVSIHLDYLQRPHQRWCELIGDEGMLLCDFVKGTVKLFEGKSREWVSIETGDDANAEYRRELEHFLECVASRSTPMVDGLTARQSLMVAVAAKQSSAEGQPIDLDMSGDLFRVLPGTTER